MSFEINNFRNAFPIFKRNDLIFLDNASTTQKPKIVINSIKNFYHKYNSNVHRGNYKIAEKATLEYEKSRGIIANFINSNKDEIIFTKSTTESINIIANGLGYAKFKKNDEVIISEMEHHSNIIPWHILSKNFKIKVKYIPLLKDGTLDIALLPKLITSKTKLISITHMSNVLGTINPLKKIIQIAKKNNIEILIDAAQSISHIKIDVKKLDCDYLVFSGHKIMGPTGVGVLYAKKEILETLPPLLGGGQMIKEVTLEGFTYNDIPWKFEAGTPNIAQAIGLGEAIKFLTSFNMTSLHIQTKKLHQYLIKLLNEIPEVKIYTNEYKDIGPITSFTINNVHGYDLSKLLSTYNICIRSGHHCAQPILNKFKISSICRISLYFYNTEKEINEFIKRVKEIINLLLK